MKPRFTDKEIRDLTHRFFENWAHLKEMADALTRIAVVLEKMEREDRL